MSITASTTVGGTLSIEFASVKADVNSGVSYTLSGTFSQGATVTLSPGQHIYAQYGIRRQVARGHLYYLASNCKITNNRGWVTTWTPWDGWWHLWT